MCHASSSIYSSECHSIDSERQPGHAGKKDVGVPLAHATAELVRGHPALVKPGREEVFAEYVGI